MKRHRAAGWTPPRGGADTPDTIDAAPDAVSDADSPLARDALARDALSCEALEPAKTASLLLDDDLRAVCAGIGFAFGALMQGWSRPGAAPMLFDERTLPSELCATGAPVVSFVWTDRRLRAIDRTARARLCAKAMEDLLLLVAERTGASIRELVSAYVLVERVVRSNATILKPWTARLLLLAALSLVTKAAHDYDVRTADVLDPLADIFAGLDATELARIEWELLAHAEYRVPIDGDAYATYLTELLAVGGGGRLERDAARALLRVVC